MQGLLCDTCNILGREMGFASRIRALGAATAEPPAHAVVGASWFAALPTFSLSCSRREAISNYGEVTMAEERRGSPSVALDPALLEAHPELAVLALELPDSDGEPVENERERLQINLLLDALGQYWHNRQDFYAAGNMFLYYSTEQARQVLAEEAEPARPRRAFRGP